MSDQPSVNNRIAVVVTPKEPYLAWARRLDDDDGPSIDEVPSEELTKVYPIEEALIGNAATDQFTNKIRKLTAWVVPRRNASLF